MIESFTAIDFETANSRRSSICQIGLVHYKQGIITNEYSILVQPPNNIYWAKMTDIHGINAEHTANAPTFDQVWLQIEPYISNQTIVTHCGFTFDFNCLRQTLDYYQLATPPFNGQCTYKIYKDNLALLCEQYNIPLNHHDALSDAKACGELYKLFLQKK